MDDLVFARMNAISLTQLRELEGHGQGSFYNAHIKASTGIKLLKKLGHSRTLPEPEPTQLCDPATQIPAPGIATMPVLNAMRPHAASPQISPSTLRLRLFKDKSPTIEPKWVGALLTVCIVMWALSSTRGREWRPSSETEAYKTAPSAPRHLTLATHQAAPANTRLDPVPNTPPHDSPPSALPVALNNAAPVQARTGNESNPGNACDEQHIHNSFVHQSVNPIKVGNYIHFVADQDAALCVRDHQGKLSRLQLSAGASRSVYGAPPFLVHSTNWPGLQVFFQGRRVTGTPERPAHWVFKSKETSQP